MSITICSSKLSCHSSLRQTSGSSAHVTLHWDLHHASAYDPIREMNSCRDLQPASRTITKVFSPSTRLISPAARWKKAPFSKQHKHADKHHISVNPVPACCCRSLRCFKSRWGKPTVQKPHVCSAPPQRINRRNRREHALFQYSPVNISKWPTNQCVRGSVSEAGDERKQSNRKREMKQIQMTIAKRQSWLWSQECLVESANLSHYLLWDLL